MGGGVPVDLGGKDYSLGGRCEVDSLVTRDEPTGATPSNVG